MAKRKRGRPPTGKPLRVVEIRARVTSEEKQTIQQAAELGGWEVSERMRKLLLRDANRIINKHEA